MALKFWIDNNKNYRKFKYKYSSASRNAYIERTVPIQFYFYILFEGMFPIEIFNTNSLKSNMDINLENTKVGVVIRLAFWCYSPGTLTQEPLTFYISTRIFRDLAKRVLRFHRASKTFAQFHEIFPEVRQEKSTGSHGTAW